MTNFICFDLEGPLSPQDHAYEVMRLILDGQKLFEILSHYDDLLTLEGQENHEPGDTLKFITPFLICGGVTENDLKKISQEAKLTEGAKEFIDELKKTNWKIFIISSAFEQHALNIAEKVGIPQSNVFSTQFPLDSFRREINREEVNELGPVKEKIILLRGDKEIKDFLDEFFGEKVPRDYPTINKVLNTVQVIGGSRKVEALKAIQALF